MKVDNDKFSVAQIDWENDIPASKEYGDVYFSLVDGLKESQYVFVDANDLPSRFGTDFATDEHRRSPFIISEAGFGTGLNFLNTWNNWQTIKPTIRRPLHFISFEKHPLSKDDLVQSLSKWPEISTLSMQLCEAYPITMEGHHTLTFEQGGVVLSLVFGDILDKLPEYQYHADCWYLDGFSPNKNPKMWSQELFYHIARLSKHQTSFSTFAAASSVRKGLESAGFTVQRRKGFGKKREMLLGKLNQNNNTSLSCPPNNSYNWSRPTPDTESTLGHHENKLKANDTYDVIVIGAGLAGCSTASSLQKRGVKVALLDKHPQAVKGASGQSQLVMYAKFPSERNKLFNFIEHCLTHSTQYYTSLQAKAAEEETGAANFWHPCGLLQLAWNEKEQRKQARFNKNISYPNRFIRHIDASEASRVSGITQECGGLWFENAGWLDPKLYTDHILGRDKSSEQKNLETFYNEKALELTQRPDKHWLIRTNSRTLISKNVVICNANDAISFDQCKHLPIKPLRGQVSSIKARTTSIPATQCVLTGEGYLCPPLDGWHHFGATFNLDNHDTRVNPADNEKNFLNIQEWNPNWLRRNGETTSKLKDFELKSNAGLRCTTPDYLPIVGQAPIYDEMLETFAKLRVGANSCRHLHGHYYEGLYLNIGHGSKGAFTTPISAAFITQEICGGISPLNETHRTMLSPARFIIKHLKQRRI